MVMNDSEVVDRIIIQSNLNQHEIKESSSSDEIIPIISVKEGFSI